MHRFSHEPNLNNKLRYLPENVCSGQSCSKPSGSWTTSIYNIKYSFVKLGNSALENSHYLFIYSHLFYYYSYWSREDLTCHMVVEPNMTTTLNLGLTKLTVFFMLTAHSSQVGILSLFFFQTECPTRHAVIDHACNAVNSVLPQSNVSRKPLQDY